MESRVCDQQLPDTLIVPATMTVGLVSAAVEGWEVLRECDWNDLRKMRDTACRTGLAAQTDEADELVDLCKTMMEVVELGLKRRKLGEEELLAPLWRRLRNMECPADGARNLFEDKGLEALLEARQL